MSGSRLGQDAVLRTRQAAKNILEMKFPGVEPTDASIKLTCSLEIKYSLFTQEKGVEKSGQLSNLEVLK